MKPETNLFLRSLIGKEKARLCAEKTRIVSDNCAQSPASLRLPPEDVDKIIQIDRDAKELNSALSELRKEAEKQASLGENAQDDAPITAPVDTPIETQAEKPKITRSTDKDIERIRYELDRAVTIAEQVAKQSPLVAPTQPLFQVEAAMLLKSVYSALTEFNAVYPEEE